MPLQNKRFVPLAKKGFSLTLIFVYRAAKGGDSPRASTPHSTPASPTNPPRMCSLGKVEMGSNNVRPLDVTQDLDVTQPECTEIRYSLQP